MTKLAWDVTGEHLYETGVDRGVLFIPDDTGVYVNGVAWNGLTTVTESPSGAEATAQYADNAKYLNLISAEQFAATLEAFTYPDEFAQFDGLGSLSDGVVIGQQSRKSFGLCYRTRKGNDLDGDDHGYKLHIIYGCTAAPSEKAYATVNDSPAAINFSWAISTTPVAVTDMKPTALLVIDSTEVDSDTLAALETILYGATGVDPALPLPDAIKTMFDSGITVITTVTVPTYVSGTHTLTIPTLTGVTYYNEDTGVIMTAGAHVLTSGQTILVKARANPDYEIAGGQDTDWMFTY